MLSKYYHLEKNIMGADKADINIFIPALLADLREEYGDIKIKQEFPGGTLGVFFELYINSKRKFIKTHQRGSEYEENLLKEIEIMSEIYGDIIEIEKIEIEKNGKKQCFMVMDYLSPCQHPLEPDETKKCIDYYQKKLLNKNIKAKYTFQQLLNAGEKSLNILYEQGFLEKTVFSRCNNSLQHIKEKDIPHVISHGDLSNVNIMYTKSKIPVVVDWEDSLYAFQEYDFLYWLTFFSQRKYYSPILFKKNRIDEIWGIDIMVLIIIIKSYMAYQNGSYKSYKISFQERIDEIYNIMNI